MESPWKEEQGLWDARAVPVQSQAEEEYSHLASLPFSLSFCYYLSKPRSPAAVEVLAIKLNWWWNTVLGGNLVHLEHMYKARCPKSRQALLLGKDFHLHRKRLVLISILMPRFPVEHRKGSSCLLHLHLFEPLLFFFLMGRWWSRYVFQWNLSCLSGRASVGWLD